MQTKGNKMKQAYYFLKWNFSGMESYSKRYLTYLILGVILGLTIHTFIMMISLVLIIVDMIIDIIRWRFDDFKREQQAMLEKLAEDRR